MSNEKLSALVRSATAFRSYPDLLASIKADGYIPTLNRENESERELAVQLVELGHSVFMIGADRPARLVNAVSP